MQRRVAELAPGMRVWLSTFHRFGARLLRQYAEFVGLAPNFTIYDTNDARQTIKRVIEAHSIKTLHFTPDRLAEAISGAKNKLVTPDRYEPRPGSTLSHVVAEVYPRYQERMLASAAVDFDDLLLHVAQLLHDHPEIRAELDERFPLCAGRRVSRHEQGPVRDPAGAVARLSEPGGDRRSRSIDLRLAGRRPQQHSRVRARLSGRADRPAGAELPQHETHPADRRRADRPQPPPQAKETLDRERRRRRRCG